MLEAHFGFWGSRLILLVFLLLIAKPAWWFILNGHDDNKTYTDDPDPEKKRHL